MYRVVLLLANVSSLSNWMNRHVRAKPQPVEHLQLCSLSSNSELHDGGWLSVSELPAGSFQVAQVQGPLPPPNNSLEPPVT